MAGVIVRDGSAADLAAVARIQAASPEASQWNPADYLHYDFAVATRAAEVAGFIVSRRVADDEVEVLNLAVHPVFRRQGVGRILIDRVRFHTSATVYLEVRESNEAARRFYEHLGFQVFTLRPRYYEASGEAAIVLKFHSC